MRAIALAILAFKGANAASVADTAEIAKQYGIEGAFTPEEQAFVTCEVPSERECRQFSWRYECVNVLIWALGLVEKLERPDALCDVDRLETIIRERGRERFVADASLRLQSELLDAADLIYRYHWAVREEHLQGRSAPAGLDADVIMERHHALNWLIGYMDQDWDDVSTDT